MLRDVLLLPVGLMFLAVANLVRVAKRHRPEPLPNNVVSLDDFRAREQSKEARR